VVVTSFGAWRRINFSHGLLLESAAIILIGLFVAQAIFAHPNRMYAMPIGAALLMLLGAMLEFCVRSAVTFAKWTRTRTALPSAALIHQSAHRPSLPNKPIASKFNLTE
jgi:hypothetical protein